MVYDLIVLGGGPAGYLAAERAGHGGMKVLCLEGRSFGGVCLNEGCVPTKTLLYSAKLYDGVKHGEKYGVTASGLAIDHSKVVQRKDKVVRTLVAGVQAALKANHVETKQAFGKIAGRTPEGYAVEAAGETYVGKRLLIATGSNPAVPPIPGLKEGLERGFVMTNREILDLREAPGRLAVIGGRCWTTSPGKTTRTWWPCCKSTMRKRASASSFPPRSPRWKGAPSTMNGRRANTANIGLETIGVLTERGAIVTDRHMRTNQPEVYAAGDVNGRSMLAHTAYREAEVAVNNMLGKRDVMRYNAIPGVLYTNPELAAVGETEYTAKQKGLDVQVVKLPLQYSGRYVAENEGGNGIFKLVVDQKQRTVLGAQALCNYASEFIVAVGAFIELGLTLEEIKEVVFPHPTVCEIIREAVFQA